MRAARRAWGVSWCLLFAAHGFAASRGDHGVAGAGDDIVASLADFDKAYDGAVVGAMGKAAHAAGRSRLGNLQDVRTSRAETGAATGNPEDQLAAFEESYDQSVSNAFAKSEDAVDGFREEQRLGEAGQTQKQGGEVSFLQLGEVVGACQCQLCGEANEPKCCLTNECDNSGKAHLTNYDEVEGLVDCNQCDATDPKEWTADMNTYCPQKCEAWKQKGQPTPAPAPTPAPMLKTPIPKDVARPFMHDGQTYTAPFPNGVPYERTKEERRAEANLKVAEDRVRITAGRLAVAEAAAKVANEKLKNAKKPEGYDELHAPVAKTPYFPYTHTALYSDQRIIDTGPVNDIPKLNRVGAVPEPAEGEPGPEDGVPTAEPEEEGPITLDAPMPAADDEP